MLGPDTEYVFTPISPWMSSSTYANLHLSFPKVRACLFDMDGLLIDSEDIYTFCNNVILQQYGRPCLPWNVKAQLQGRPGPEVRHRVL